MTPQDLSRAEGWPRVKEGEGEQGVVPGMRFYAGPGAASIAVSGPGRTGSSQAATAEDPQLYLLGFVQEGTTKLAILGWAGLVDLVREGDIILGTYRVELLGEDVVILREGEREIRASFRPKQPDRPPLQPGPYGTMAASDPGLSAPDQTSQGLMPSGASRPSDTSVTGSTVGVGLLPASPFATGTPGGGTPQGQEENPFARALRERAQGTPTPDPPQDNPFLRALRRRSSVPASPQENPFQRGIQQGSSMPPPDENPFLKALRGRGD